MPCAVSASNPFSAVCRFTRRTALLVACGLAVGNIATALNGITERAFGLTEQKVQRHIMPAAGSGVAKCEVLSAVDRCEDPLAGGLQNFRAISLMPRIHPGRARVSPVACVFWGKVFGRKPVNRLLPLFHFSRYACHFCARECEVPALRVGFNSRGFLANGIGRHFDIFSSREWPVATAKNLDASFAWRDFGVRCESKNNLLRPLRYDSRLLTSTSVEVNTDERVGGRKNIADAGVLPACSNHILKCAGARCIASPTTVVVMPPAARVTRMPRP